MVDTAHAVGDALQLVDLVRNYGPDVLHGVIDRWDDDTRRAVLVALAAAVDPDKTRTQLWGWLGEPLPQGETTVEIRDVWHTLEVQIGRRDREERRRMVDQLTSAGYSRREIALRLRTDTKTVERDRRHLRTVQEAS